MRRKVWIKNMRMFTLFKRDTHVIGFVTGTHFYRAQYGLHAQYSVIGSIVCLLFSCEGQ